MSSTILIELGLGLHDIMKVNQIKFLIKRENVNTDNIFSLNNEYEALNTVGNLNNNSKNVETF